MSKDIPIKASVLEEAAKVATLQASLFNLTTENVESVIAEYNSSQELNIFLHNVFIAAEYRPFSIPNLIKLCAKINGIKRFLLQVLANPKILSIEKMYFLSKCRDADLITNEEVNDAVKGKTIDEDLFNSCFFNDKGPGLIPLEGEDIEDVIRSDSVDDLKKCFANNNTYQIDYRIAPSIQFGSHFLRSQPTLIQYASFCGSVNIFKYLLENGANLDLKDLNGRSLVQFAVAGGNKEIIDILKGKRCDMTGTMKFAVRFHRNDLFEFIDDDPIPILHHCTASNNISLILKCLEHGSNVNQPDYLNSNTPIQIAAEFNALDALPLFLNHSRINVNATNKEGQTALHIAASKDFVEFARQLIGNEFVNQRKTDHKGRMALHIAAENGHVDVVQLFLSKGGVTVNSRTDYGATSLHMALNSGEIEMIEYLLTVDDIDVNAKTLTEETPIHCAAQNGRSEAIQLLLTHNVDPNPHDKDGWTPLHYATQRFFVDTISILISSPEIDVNAQNRTGWTSLHLAAKMANLEIVELLLSTGNVKINEADNDGWTALHFAAKSGNVDVVKAIVSYPGVNINVEDKAGWSPLHDAVKYQNHDVIALLLQQNEIAINSVTNSKWVPLHIAYLNHDQRTKDMLEAMPGILKDAKDSEGRTPEDLGKIPVFGNEEDEGDAPRMVYFNGC